MFLPEVKKQLSQIAVGILILSTIMVLCFLVLGYFDKTVVFGAILGSGWAFANFTLLAIAVQKAVDKEDGQAAKAYMSGTYTLRLILTAVMVIVAIKLPYVNYLAAIIPIVFPRITIMAVGLIDKKRGKDVTP